MFAPVQCACFEECMCKQIVGYVTGRQEMVLGVVRCYHMAEIWNLDLL